MKQSEETKEKVAHPFRFLFLDGLRGLAALYVVLFHTLGAVKNIYFGGSFAHSLSPLARNAVSWMNNGHLAVDIFIVLSGYCLMLPVVHSETGRLKGGFAGYMKRRAWRILPPYYVVLAISIAPLLLSQLAPSGAGPVGAGWRFNFSPLAIGSHLLLMHNLFPSTQVLYDPPMWSIATEWQIYFLFPLLLVLWRRAGIMVMVLAAMVTGMLPHFLLPRYNLDWACPWYLGLFAMGMLGAYLSVSERGRRMLRGAAWPWAVVALVLFVPGFIAGLNEAYQYTWISDMVIGAATCCFLVFCARHAYAANTCSPALRMLENRWVVLLGTFSYSLYLIHLLVIMYYARALQRFHVAHLAAPLPFFVICIVVSLAASYVFFLLVERHFLPGHLRSEARDAIATVVAPAP